MALSNSESIPPCTAPREPHKTALPRVALLRHDLGRHCLGRDGWACAACAASITAMADAAPVGRLPPAAATNSSSCLISPGLVFA